jgi:hypothetical protein
MNPHGLRVKKSKFSLAYYEVGWSVNFKLRFLKRLGSQTLMPIIFEFGETLKPFARENGNFSSKTDKLPLLLQQRLIKELGCGFLQ